MTLSKQSGESDIRWENNTCSPEGYQKNKRKTDAMGFPMVFFRMSCYNPFMQKMFLTDGEMISVRNVRITYMRGKHL